MLPLPASSVGGGHKASLSRPRNLKALLVCTLVSLCLIVTYLRPASAPTLKIDMAALERILEEGASDAVILEAGTYDGPGLTRLGLEADESFHLGNTTLATYRLELENFVTASFPKAYQDAALKSIKAHLGPDPSSWFDPIPHRYVIAFPTSPGGVC